MLPSINGVFRLTREVELKYTPSGTAIGKLGLVSSEKHKDKEEVCFIDATSFGKQAEILSQYLSKGSQVYILGKLSLEQWEKNGEKKSKHSIKIDKFDFVGGKSESTQTKQPNPNYQHPGVSYEQPQQQPSLATFEQEEIPFN
jgi:single-strand DNA-binding protein